MNEMKEMVIRELQYFVKTYDAINKAIVMTKNRLTAINPDMDHKHDTILNGAEDKNGNEKSQGLEQIKSRISRQIKKHLDFFPIWSNWMEKIPGIGPDIAAKLILAYYYRFVPICRSCGADYGYDDNGVMNKTCPSCEKKAKGDGVLVTRIERKEFPTVSKWWTYMGRGADEDGNMPKRKKGVKANWSSKNRVVTWNIWQQFNRQNGNHLYKSVLLEKREKKAKQHPDYTKGKNLNQSGAETAKLFLAHFWHVARTLEGLSTESPWIIAHGGHSHVIPPFYFE